MDISSTIYSVGCRFGGKFIKIVFSLLSHCLRKNAKRRPRPRYSLVWSVRNNSRLHPIIALLSLLLSFGTVQTDPIQVPGPTKNEGPHRSFCDRDCNNSRPMRTWGRKIDERTEWRGIIAL